MLRDLPIISLSNQESWRREEYMTNSPHTMEIVIWPIDRLVPYARNPRKNDAVKVPHRVLPVGLNQ